MGTLFLVVLLLPIAPLLGPILLAIFAFSGRYVLLAVSVSCGLLAMGYVYAECPTCTVASGTYALMFLAAVCASGLIGLPLSMFFRRVDEPKGLARRASLVNEEPPCVSVLRARGFSVSYDRFGRWQVSHPDPRSFSTFHLAKSFKSGSLNMKARHMCARPRPNWSVDTDAQVRPLPLVAPVLVRRSPLR